MNEINKSHLLAANDSAMTVELEDEDLERRLSLYQVFLCLYERHSRFLDDILQLENLSHSSLAELKPRYVQGVVDGSDVYVITNLSENQTQTLQQPQHIWTIGRDRTNGIYIGEQYLSRRHAAIQYVENQGFYLIDFNSTNGSFVNNERAYQPIKLKDGDRIRLGSMTFDFFYNHTRQVLPTVAMELLMQLVPHTDSNQTEISTYEFKKSGNDNPNDTVGFSINSQLEEKLEQFNINLKAEQQSEILDRFLNRQTSYNSSS